MKNQVIEFDKPMKKLCLAALVVVMVLAWPAVEASAQPWLQTYELLDGSQFLEPAVPADFFEPGSDPFDWTISHGFSTDTIIIRLDDSAPPPPPINTGTIDIEIVALSLTSIAPVTVTYGGGLTTQDWDVQVDLAPGGDNTGQIQAIRTHENGGVFSSDFVVQPRFTFTNVADPLEIRIFDSVIEGYTGEVQTLFPDSPWCDESPFGLPDDFNPGCDPFFPGGPFPLPYIGQSGEFLELLLTPEPSTLALLVLGLPGLIRLRRKRRLAD